MSAMFWSLTLLYALGFGGAFVVLVLAGQLVARDALLHDYPPAIQQRYGPQSARGRRVARWTSAGTALLLVATPLLGMLSLAHHTGAVPGFWDGFVFGTVLFATLTAADLVIIDWWLFCTPRSRLFVLPGTEGMPEYTDRAFHLRVLVPAPVPWPLLAIPGYGLAVGGAAALAGVLL
ncbi:hypothetical protein [Marinactinospora rubrisoli]|uniref:Uncharacterized protein n=1 Tax=Marinactinospora rubrisoli TaxID=2715399 RepID=A0ABW2KFZ0_9ACTN